MKILVTGGCSFSECVSLHIDTWPRQLANILSGYRHISTGLGSQGNGLISRKIIYQVSNLLKTTPAENILVGTQWSSPDRHDFYYEDVKFNSTVDGWMENPTSVITGQPNWVILNPWWSDHFSKQYYSIFHSDAGALIHTCEHILRTQWFLKLHNIKYFMSTYTSKVFPKNITHPEIKYLYDQIDLSNFLPVVGQYEWCRDHSELEFPVPTDNHPGSDQHKAFTEQVIIPFLQDKKYI